MQKLGLCFLLASLAGCANQVGGSMNAPGPGASSYSYARTNSNMPNSGVNVRAINAAITANKGPYLAPEDEVFQQSMTDPF